MKRPDEVRLDRLPKYAKRYVLQLEREIERLKSWTSPDGDPESGILLATYNGETRWAPRDARVIVNGIEVKPTEEGEPEGLALYHGGAQLRKLAAVASGGVNTMEIILLKP